MLCGVQASKEQTTNYTKHTGKKPINRLLSWFEIPKKAFSQKNLGVFHGYMLTHSYKIGWLSNILFRNKMYNITTCPNPPEEVTHLRYELFLKSCPNSQT